MLTSFKYKILLLLVFASMSFANMQAQVLLYEDFESGALPAGWSQEYTSPNTDWVFQDGGFQYITGTFVYPQTPDAAYEGSYNAAFKGTGACKTMLVTTNMDMSDPSKVYVLSFWHYQACNYNQYLNIYYKETATGSWNLITALEENTTEWTEVKVSVPSTDAEVYIGFEATWDGGCGICVDSVAIEALSTYDIDFTVVDESLTPIPSASVKLRDNRQNTAADGTVSFINVREGYAAPVVVTKQGYRPYQTTIDITSDINQQIILEPSATFYVKETAAGTESGSNWTDAFTDFQTALDNALAGDQIWVAAGRYFPSEQWGATSQQASFELKNDITIYCGFEGNPGDEGDFSTRDFETYKAVFSGDIDQNDDIDANGLSTGINGSNAYNIFRNSDNGIQNTAILNGAYISGGITTAGAAIYNFNVSPIFINCHIVGNTSLQGAAYNYGGAPFYLDCNFENNIGGGLALNQSQVYISSCSFTDNTNWGVHINDCSVDIDSSYFASNPIGIHNETALVDISNCRFSNNTDNDILNEVSSLANIVSSQFISCQNIAIDNNSSNLNIDSCEFTNIQKRAILNNDLLQTAIVSISASTFENNGDNSLEGAAIYSNNLKNLTISESSFIENKSTIGGAIYNENIQLNPVEITNCIFSGNQIAEAGGSAIKNINSQVNILHCTFSGNTPMAYDGVVDIESSTIEIHNSIFWGNRPSLTAPMSEIHGVSTTTVSDCIIQGGYSSGINIIDEDPYFVDAEYNVFRLKGYSPALDAGPDVSVSTDINGDIRPQNAAFDLGAYERPLGIDIVRSFPADNEKLVGDISDMYIVFNEDIIVNTGTISIYTADDSTLVESIDIATINHSGDSIWFSTTTPVSNGSYYILISANAFTGAVTGYPYIGISYVTDLNFSVYNEQIYVKQNAAGANNGSDWDNAYNILQDAIDTAVAGQEIWVAQGIYMPTKDHIWVHSEGRTKTFTLKYNVKLYGGFEGISGTEGSLLGRDPEQFKTIATGYTDLSIEGIDGSVRSNSGSKYHVFYHDASEMGYSIDTSTVIDGFIITGGNSNAFMGDYVNGGGIFLNQAAIRISNCLFANNTTYSNQETDNPTHIYGAAIYCESPPSGDTLIIEGCAFTFNESEPIGLKNANAKINFCSFQDNVGGIIAQSSNSIVTQSYFRDNTDEAIETKTSGTFELQNLLLVNNSGTSVIKNYSGATINSSYLTIANNSSSVSIDAIGSHTIINSIIWDESAAQSITENGSETVSFSIVRGGYASGTNIIEDDPLFVNPDSSVFKLLSCSPAIDAANSAIAPAFDIEDVVRPQFAGYDMGTYEFVDCSSYVFRSGFDVFWIGYANRDWHNTENWNTGAIPTATDNVFIPGRTSNCNIPLISAPAECKTITVESTEGAKVEIDVDNSGNLDVNP